MSLPDHVREAIHAQITGKQLLTNLASLLLQGLAAAVYDVPVVIAQGKVVDGEVKEIENRKEENVHVFLVRGDDLFDAVNAVLSANRKHVEKLPPSRN